MELLVHCSEIPPDLLKFFEPVVVETKNITTGIVLRQEQFAGDHYACFPSELPGLAIQCGTSNKGVCPKCGLPHVRVLQKKLHIDQKDRISCRENKPKGDKGRCTVPTQDLVEEYETTDWRPSCSCPENKKPIPALVLDIFSGSGTTGIACQRTGRRYLGLELNPDYADASRERLRTRGHSVRKVAKKDQDKSIFKGLP